MPAGTLQPPPPDEYEQSGKKRRFKLLEETAPAEQEPPERLGVQQDRFQPQPKQFGAPPQGGSLPGFVKMLIIPLIFAALMKAWTTVLFMQSGQQIFPIIADQIGQILVCVCLIIICASAGNQRS
jgi:hypothetical protein